MPSPDQPELTVTVTHDPKTRIEFADSAGRVLLEMGGDRRRARKKKKAPSAEAERAVRAKR